MIDDVQDIIHKAVFMSLATIDEDGSPRSTIVVGKVDGDEVVWHSDPATHHSQNIKRDGRIGISAFCKEGNEPVKGVYLSGKAYDTGKEGYDEKYDNPTHEYRAFIGVYDTAQSKPNRLYFKEELTV